MTTINSYLNIYYTSVMWKMADVFFYALVLTVKYAECQFGKIRVQYLTDVLYINNAKEIINIMKRRK